MKSKILEAGQKFSRLTVIKLDHIEVKQRKSIFKKVYNKNFEYYLCKCECGNECIVEKSALKLSSTKSCGCLQKEKLEQIHINCRKHGLSNSRIYHTWQSMKQRCFDIKDKHYKHYGARNITICNEWLDFTSFYNWAMQNGYNDTLTIERINVNGNYEPNNCKWITAKEQAKNKRNSIKILYNNKTYTVKEFTILKNIPQTTLLRKITKIKDNFYNYTDK